MDFHTIGWVQLKLVCGKSHPLANSVGDWKHLKRHQQIMFAVRTEGMERHRLRVAAEVWWFANHWSFCRFYCRTMARTRWRWSWFGTKNAHRTGGDLLRKRFATTKIDIVAE